MDWATYIPGLTALIDGFLQTALGELIVENRDWLFDGLGVSLVLGIFATLSAIARVVLGWTWTICYFCAESLYESVALRRGRSATSQPDDQTQPEANDNARPEEYEAEEPTLKQSQVLHPSPHDIFYYGQVSPDFDPFSKGASRRREKVSNGAFGATGTPAASRLGEPSPNTMPYFAWPRYFGTLAKLLLLAAALNAIWVGYVWLR